MSHVRRAVACVGALAVTLLLVSPVVARGRGRSGVDRRGRCRGRLAEDPAATRRRLRGRRASPASRPATPSLAIAEQRPDRRRRGARARRWPRSRPCRSAAPGPTPLDALDAYAETIPTPAGPDRGRRGEDHRPRREPARARPDRVRPCRRRHAGRPGDLMGGCSGTSRPTFNDTLYVVLARAACVCGAPPAAALDGGQRRAAGERRVELRRRPHRRRHRPRHHRARGRGAGRRRCRRHRPGGARRARRSSPRTSRPTARGSLRCRRPELHGDRRSSASPPPGYDVDSSCWRDTAAPSLAGTAVREPDRVAALAATHAPPPTRAASPARTTASA